MHPGPQKLRGCVIGLIPSKHPGLSKLLASFSTSTTPWGGRATSPGRPSMPGTTPAYTLQLLLAGGREAPAGKLLLHASVKFCKDAALHRNLSLFPVSKIALAAASEPKQNRMF